MAPLGQFRDGLLDEVEPFPRRRLQAIQAPCKLLMILGRLPELHEGPDDSYRHLDGLGRVQHEGRSDGPMLGKRQHTFWRVLNLRWVVANCDHFGKLLPGQPEHEIPGEPIKVPAHLLVQSPRLNPVEHGQIRGQDHPSPPQDQDVPDHPLGRHKHH